MLCRLHCIVRNLFLQYNRFNSIISTTLVRLGPISEGAITLSADLRTTMSPAGWIQGSPSTLKEQCVKYHPYFQTLLLYQLMLPCTVHCEQSIAEQGHRQREEQDTTGLCEHTVVQQRFSGKQVHQQRDEQNTKTVLCKHTVWTEEILQIQIH
jgi:hypothetical protein